MSFSDVVNELKLHRTSVLESRIESAEDFKVQLAQMDIQNNILSDIRRSVVAMAGIMDASNSRLAEALSEQNRLAEDAALRAKLASEGKDKEKVVEAKLARDQEPKEVGGLLGKLLGLLKGLVLGGVAAVLGSELWLALRGITDGTAFDDLRDDIGAIGAKIAVVGTAVRRFVPVIGRFAKIVPGLGQAILVVTGLFTGIKEAFESYKTSGELSDAIIDGVTAGLTAVVNSFVDVLSLIGVPTETIQKIKDGVAGLFDRINLALKALYDRFTTSDLEARRNELVDENKEIARRLRSARRMGLNEDAMAQIEQEALENMRMQRVANLRIALDRAGGSMDTLSEEYVSANLEELEAQYGTYANQSDLRRANQRDMRQKLEEAELLNVQVRARERAELSAGNARRGGDIGDMADRVSQLERQSMVIAPIVATDASQTNTNIQTNNTMVSGVLRPEYDGLSAY